ncbi:MAG: hypothetical protein IT320_06390 [Anaerolineae bacterium]|nr:hypothetical protein [Anaerolineae bacterium]
MNFYGHTSLMEGSVNMSLETSHVQLAQAMAHLEKDETAEALRLLNDLIEKVDLLDAHRLRFTILIKRIDNPHDLRASLDVLRTEAPDIYSAGLVELETQIHNRLSELQDGITEATQRAEMQSYLDEYDALVVLSDLFPVIQVARGLGYMAAARIRDKKGQPGTESPYEHLRRLLAKDMAVPFMRERNETDSVDDTQAERWRMTAEQALSAALISLTPNHPSVVEIHEVLGMLYEGMHEYSKALRSFQAAIEHGSSNMEDKVHELTTKIKQETERLALERVDSLLANQHLDEAETCLAEYAPDALTDAWHLRYAELALLRGDRETAMHHYALILPLVHNK